MRICIFEDDDYRKLLPLVYFRPVYDLKCGITTLREKLVRSVPDSTLILHVREYLKDFTREKNPGTLINEIPAASEPVLFVNGRIIMSANEARALGSRHPGKDTAYWKENVVLAAWVSGRNLESIRSSVSAGKPLSTAAFGSFEKKNLSEATLINYPWDIIHHNGAQIVSDFEAMTGGKPQRLGVIYDGAHLLNPSQIHVADGAKVKPGVVLDAEGGPIFISRNAKIMPNAVIEGPAFVGENSIVKVSAKIYENTTIGETCKVGGEVEESVIHAYSNKQHEGFIGHAYLAEWVNIGADSNNSDLKNDYGNVKVYNDGKLVDTGSQFVGLTMGDHSKCGINSMFNTGAVVSICCNVFGAGLLTKFVPAFSWGGETEGLVTYKLDKAIEVARRVMARRKMTLSDAGAALFRKTFELTREERDAANIGG